MSQEQDIFEFEINLDEEVTESADATKGKSKEITADVYNSAISRLKQSFKEATELMELLEDTSIVPITLDEAQDAYAEAAMEEAYLMSLCDGPYFERSDRIEKSDKQAIKQVINKISDEIANEPNDKYRLISFYPMRGISGRVINYIAKSSWVSMKANPNFKPYFWQMVGVFKVNKSAKETLEDALKYYTNKWKEFLGDFVFNAMDVATYAHGRTEGDVTYCLIVDVKKEAVKKLTEK